MPGTLGYVLPSIKLLSSIFGNSVKLSPRLIKQYGYSIRKQASIKRVNIDPGLAPMCPEPFQGQYNPSVL